MATTLKEKRDYLRTAAGFTAVALVAAGLIWLGNRNDAITEAERLKAGILTAHQVKAAFEGVGGRIVARPKEESDRVVAGEVIMAIDPTDVEIAIREAEAQIRLLDAQIAELEGTIELTLRTADATERETWRRIEEAEAARRTSAADLENARLVHERAKRLRPSGAVSEADYDAAKSVFEAKRAALQGAERSIRALAVGADERELSNLRKTGSAEGMRLSAVENARFSAENQRNTLANLHASRDAAAAGLDDLKVDRDRLTLEAPQAGKILELLFEEGRNRRGGRARGASRNGPPLRRNLRERSRCGPLRPGRGDSALRSHDRAGLHGQSALLRGGARVCGTSHGPGARPGGPHALSRPNRRPRGRGGFAHRDDGRGAK